MGKHALWHVDKMGAVRLTGATTVDWFNVTRSSSGGSQPGVTSQCESRNVTVGALEWWKPTTRERISPSRRALRTYETRGSARIAGETFQTKNQILRDGEKGCATYGRNGLSDLPRRSVVDDDDLLEEMAGRAVEDGANGAAEC